jgi:hypothetical protein
VVADFGIKYHHRSDFDFLVSILSLLYHMKALPVSSKFLGFTLNHNCSTRSLFLSYPGYVSTLLTRLRPHGLPPAASPTLYIPPSYGSRAHQSPTGPDIPPPASPTQFKELQVAVGYLLYYGRSVDARILTATCDLASEQAAPTLATISRLNRLLSFVSAHPNGRKIYRASDMILCIHSDASYLSRPNAGSVAGSFHYLGSSYSFHPTLPDDFPINHPVSARSTKIPVVVSFVAEAEYAALFASARIAVDERQILADLGHPQPPTVISCDNDECAIGLANRTVTPKMSKYLDMRFHWLRDRIDQGQFRVVFVPGLRNLADFFTKSLPVARHTILAPFIATDDDDVVIDAVHLKLSHILFAAALLHNSHQAGVLMAS